MYINSHSFISAAGENTFSDALSLSKEKGRWLGRVDVPLDYDRRFERDDRIVHLAMHCAKKVQFSAHLEPCLVNLASSRGATATIEAYMKVFLKEGKLPPLVSPLTTAGRLSSSVADFLQVSGLVLDHSMTCSGGLQALMNAQQYLDSGKVEQALVGASEACLSDFTIAQFEALRLYSKESEIGCQPLIKKEHNTMVLGEGAGLMVLSNVRAADCNFRISGIGQGIEHAQHAVGLKGDNLIASMQAALLNANATRVDCVIAHAPGTVLGDRVELTAIRSVLGEVPVISNKWKFGHTLAASGILSIFWAMELMKGWRPQVPAALVEAHQVPDQLNTVMVNALGFGGNAISVLVERC